MRAPLLNRGGLSGSWKRGEKMFEKTVLHCPRCGYEIREEIEGGKLFTCSLCSGRFRVMVDEEAGRAAFYEEAARQLPEPLYLPRGSIRALTALTMAASCWVRILTGRDVPGSLLSLLLTIVGYYFGFRTKVKAAGSRIFDPSVKAREPLGLPAGVIRWILIAGFVASGLVLFGRGRLGEAKYLEFFLVMGGLIAGQLFGRLSRPLRETPTGVAINHLKGVAVLAVAALLMLHFIAGLFAGMPAPAAAVLCAVVSFYYGSRT